MSDVDAIHAVLDSYFAAYAAHDAQGCGAVYAADALCISPWGPILHGPDAIAAAHENWFDEGETNKVTRIDRIEVAGDMAICLMRFRADIPGDGSGPDKLYGSSLNTLRRQSDGNWKISCTSLNLLDRSDWNEEK